MLDSDEALSDDLADGEGLPMEEDEGEEQKEVFERTFENPMLNAEVLLPMNEDVDMVELTAPVTNELISNITEHEENNDVSLCYCQF
jgi:hypothetical protein